MTAFALAWSVRSPRTIAIAVLVQLSSILAAAELFEWSGGPVLGCAVMLLALSLLLADLRERRFERGRAGPDPTPTPKPVSIAPGDLRAAEAA